MKNFFRTLQNKSERAFTLVEMLIVLLIISVLMLLFVPNLSKQKDAVQSKGDAAVVKVVESQIELYEINEGRTPSISELTSAGYITEKQAETYHATKK